MFARVRTERKIHSKHSRRFTEPLERRLLLSAGALDPSFDGDGWSRFHLAGYMNKASVARVQSDGKIVVAGYAQDSAWHDLRVLLARCLPNGGLDPTFGSGGIVLNNLSTGAAESANDMLIQPDGRIVVVGDYYPVSTGSRAMFVARYNSNGTPDTTFANGGFLTLDPTSYDDDAYGVARQPDGKLLIAGMISSDPGYTDFAVLRLTSSGALDTNFGGGDGTFRTTFDQGPPDQYEYITDRATRVAVTPDGRIVAAGSTPHGTPGGTSDFTVVRLTSSGALDSSFDTDGKLVIDNGPDEYTAALILAPDGKLILAGARDAFSAVRILPTGELDATFGGDGKVRFGSLLTDDALLQPDGKLVLVGTESIPGSQWHSWIWLARLDASGQLDPSFGDGGVTKWNGTTHLDEANAAALQPDGRIVIVGDTGTSPISHDFDTLVARFTGSFASLANGVLTISGSTGDDTIDIQISGDSIVASLNGVEASFAAANVSTIELDGSGANDAISITGALSVTSIAPVQTIASLSLAGGASLDLKQNDLIVPGGSLGTWDSSAYDGLTGTIEAGAIFSSSAVNKSTTLGVATAANVFGITGSQTATFGGQTVSPGDVLVKFTYAGDANLDGKINIDDYGRIDANVGQSGTVFGWYNGDFNFDGKINIDDYGLIDSVIGSQGPVL